jgi:chemotaxis protein methyltransferase CheR
MTARPLQSGEYRRFAALLHEWTGIRLEGKQHLVTGRLTPRLRELGLRSFGDYLAQLEAGGLGGSEAQNFINALTTNKTSFFREAHHFDFLVKRVFPEVRQRAADGGARRLRLWSAGCSRGAEPYSMAMLAASELPPALGWDVRVLATDLDTAVLAEAKAAVYDEAEFADVPPALRQRFCLREGTNLRVHSDAAKLVTFAQANLIAEPFPVRGAFDVVFCRNVMIYFDRPTQDRLVRELSQRLLPHGYFVVGHSESLLGQNLERVVEVVGVYRAPAGATPARRASKVAPPAPRRRAPKGPPAKEHPSLRVMAKAPPRATAQLPVKRIVLGQWHASQSPMLISTLLGSCVSACLYDPVARIGGMNHFMLPRVLGSEDNPARFGVHAMELLVNELMHLGAQRNRLRATAFGAGTVNKTLISTVAAQNGAFVRQFLAQEGIPLVSERLGGNVPREVIFRTDTGECFVRKISPSAAADTVQDIEAYERQTVPPPAPDWTPDDALF